MNKQELKLYNSRTPEEYIGNSLRTSLPSGRKAFITRLWLRKKKYTIEDIKRARNRHPYWKSKKMEGSAERNEVRRRDHDYRGYGSLDWDEATIKEFMDMNKKEKSGKYQYKDFELAQHFNTTIPSIQHYRRKSNMVVAIMAKEKSGSSSKRVFQLISWSEQRLRNHLKKPKAKSKTKSKKR